MKTITIEDFQRMIAFALEDVSGKAEMFSALDAITGDGDHGMAIVSAMTAAYEAAQRGTEFKPMFDDMGFNVMLRTSGSTSTLLGAFFLGMGEAASGREPNAAAVKAMAEGGLAGVQKNTRATVGDKTIMDALIPAVEAMKECLSDDISEILAAGARAARKGAEATVEMRATFGRARNGGERSIGWVDPGASSWATIFEAFARALQQNEK